MQIGDENLNTTLNESLEIDFITAVEMSEYNYDYETLMNFLRSDKIVEKQIAVLKLTEIKSKEDAKLLTSNLVGQNGKIREVVAFKLNQLIKDERFTEFFLNKTNYEFFIQGVMDINGNVCRLIVDLASFLKKYADFSEYFCNALIENLNDIFKEIDKIDLSDKRYVVSKKNFQLYWCLEALCDFVDLIEFGKIKDIIIKSGNFYDYTIREKTAKILKQNDFDGSDEIIDLKERLKNDENYYVRRYLG